MSRLFTEFSKHSNANNHGPEVCLTGQNMLAFFGLLATGAVDRAEVLQAFDISRGTVNAPKKGREADLARQQAAGWVGRKILKVVARADDTSGQWLAGETFIVDASALLPSANEGPAKLPMAGEIIGTTEVYMREAMTPEVFAGQYPQPAGVRDRIHAQAERTANRQLGALPVAA
jgi:hypothetical protein